jgi:hypothetical protein
MKNTPKKYRKQVDILKSKYELEKQMGSPSAWCWAALLRSNGDPDFFNALIFTHAELTK